MSWKPLSQTSTHIKCAKRDTRFHCSYSKRGDKMMTDRSCIQPIAFTRRIALAGGIGLLVGAATLVAAVRQAAAKMAPAAAAYQDAPKGDQNCSNCSLFQPTKACQLVDGDISASGWCKY